MDATSGFQVLLRNETPEAEGSSENKERTTTRARKSTSPAVATVAAEMMGENGGSGTLEGWIEFVQCANNGPSTADGVRRKGYLLNSDNIPAISQSDQTEAQRNRMVKSRVKEAEARAERIKACLEEPKICNPSSPPGQTGGDGWLCEMKSKTLAGYSYTAHYADAMKGSISIRDPGADSEGPWYKVHKFKYSSLIKNLCKATLPCKTELVLEAQGQEEAGEDGPRPKQESQNLDDDNAPISDNTITKDVLTKKFPKDLDGQELDFAREDDLRPEQEHSMDEESTHIMLRVMEDQQVRNYVLTKVYSKPFGFEVALLSSELELDLRAKPIPDYTFEERPGQIRHELYGCKLIVDWEAGKVRALECSRIEPAQTDITQKERASSSTDSNT